MATKTISVNMEAYERLCRARRHASESFSEVICRARWEEPQCTGRRFLEKMARLPGVDDETLERMDEDQGSDKPPRDKWMN